MPRISSDALAVRNVLLQLDWQSRHFYFSRYVWLRGHALAREVLSLMSPDELLKGTGGCAKVEPDTVIPLPLSGPRYRRQLTLNHFGIVVRAGPANKPERTTGPCRPRYRQLKLSYFGIRVRRRIQKHTTIKDYFTEKQN